MWDDINARLKADGYVVVDGIFEIDEIIKLRSFVFSGVKTWLQAFAKCETLSNVEASEIINKALNEPEKLNDEAKHILAGHVPLNVRLNPKIVEFIENSKLPQLMRGILRSESLCMHMPPMIRSVFPGNSHARVPPHQDIAYNSHLSNFTTVWVPLVQIDELCGGVAVYESATREIQTSDLKKTNSVWLESIDVSGTPTHCTFDLGGVLLIDPKLVHCSRPNDSERVRLSMDLRFFGDGDSSEKSLYNFNLQKIFHKER